MVGVKGTGVAGHRFETADGGMGIELRVHAAGVTKGVPYKMNMYYESTMLIPFGSLALATQTYPEKIVVALETGTSGQVKSFQLYGICDAYVANGVTAGVYLEACNGDTDFTSQSSTKDVNTSAMALEANATGSSALKKIVLNDIPTPCAAS
jgi:hypothetical protein